MVSILDASVGFALESVYDTGVTVARWLEYKSEGLDFKPKRKQGQGLRVGARVARAGRRVTTFQDAGGPVEFEALSKGQGLMWQALMGAGASTLVSAATYQQVFTLGDLLQPVTIQKGVPRLNLTDGSVTIDPITFTGCVATDFELTGGQDILNVKTNWDARSVATATAYATPSFSTGANLFSFAGASLYSGTFTAPTTTALASAATPLANVTAWSCKVDRGATKERAFFGGAGKKAKPVAGEQKPTGKLDIEYTDIVFRDAFMADTDMTLLITYTAGALGVGTETLQIAIPDIRLEGELPKASGDIPKMSCTFTGLDGLTAAQPLWIVARTADAAL